MKAKARVAFPVGRVAIGLALLLIVLGAPAGAHAAQTHVFSFSAAEYLDDAQGVAVDQSSGPTAGHIWIGNGNSGLFAFPYVSILDPSGNVLTQPSPPTPFASPHSIATDNSGGPSDGDFYVGDAGNQKIYKFGPDGSLIWEVDLKDLPETYNQEFSEYHPGTINSLAVNPTTGQIFMEVFNGFPTGEFSSRIYVLGEDGGFVRNFGVGESSERSTMTVNSAGHIFIKRLGQFFQGELLEYNSDGTLLGAQAEMGLGVQGLAYDASDGDYIVDKGTEIAIYNSTFQKVDHFGAGVLEESTAVAINESTGVIYALDRRHGSTEGRLDVFTPAALPNLSTTAVSGIGGTSATLNGKVDPAGGGEVTSCEFEFGESASYGQSVACAPPTPYSGVTEVSAELTGLAPATEYHYRLSGGNANGVAHQEGDRTFVPGPAAPQLIEQNIADLGSDNARIDSSVKVMGADTRVSVEYGTTSSYGTVFPPNGTRVAATGPTDQSTKLVPIQLGGLSPDTNYHFRVVATNAAGTTTGPDQIIHTYAPTESRLPDNRGYELVSPVNKNGHAVRIGYSVATDSGDAIFYPTALSFGNAANGSQTFAVARRSNSEWVPDTPFVRPNQSKANDRFFTALYWPSADLSQLLFSGQGYTPDSEEDGLYLSSVSSTARVSSGTLAHPVLGPFLLTESQSPIGLREPIGQFVPAGAASDMSPLYFGFDGALLADETERISVLSTKDATGFYEYKDGQLLSAATLPDGSLDPEGAAPAATPIIIRASNNKERQPTEFFHQVSEDGRRAFFLSPSPSAGSPRPIELYVHREGQMSLLASRSALNGEGSPTGVLPMPRIADFHERNQSARDTPYAVASRDGSQVFFESEDPLTSDAPSGSSVKGYLYDVDTQQLSYLPGVSGAGVAISNDGSRVFFASAGELEVWEAGQGVTSIAEVGALGSWELTPDGSTMVFVATGAPAGFNNGGLRQVYRYETGPGNLECVSCPPSGTASTAGGYLSAERGTDWAGGELREPHRYAEEGRRIFFETAARLVVTDTNTTSDVYEWEDGKVYLISGGHSDQDSYLLDSSTSGDDVFFGTTDPLDPRDRDGAYDVYDARVGATTKVPDAIGCGSSCQDESGGAPISPAIVSGTGAGKGKANAGGHGQKFSARAVGGTGPVVQLAVRVPGRGHLVASGPSVETTGKQVTGAGNVRLKVPLSAKVKQKLKADRNLTVRVRIVFTPAVGKSMTTSVSVTLRRR